jgi:hypothetical protein
MGGGVTRRLPVTTVPDELAGLLLLLPLLLKEVEDEQEVGGGGCGGEGDVLVVAADKS